MQYDDYDRAVREFAWNIPEYYNLGEALIAGAQAAGGKTALIVAEHNGDSREYSFAFLDSQSNRLANRLQASGLQPGDRVAVVLPASVEAAICHLAILKAGMISLPLIEDSVTGHLDRMIVAEVALVFTGSALAEAFGGAWREKAGARDVIAIRDDVATASQALLDQVIADCSDRFTAVRTRPSDAALLSFTSGSEGRPKGVLNSHSVILGTLPMFIFSGYPVPGDVGWCHFEWGWLGGLLIAFCAWHCGTTVLIEPQGPLIPARTVALWKQFGVTRVSIAPTALKMLRISLRSQDIPKLSAITSGGEKLDGEMRQWVRSHFGTELGEAYGLTECSAVMGSGHAVPTIEDAIGKPAPGQTVEILSPDGQVLPVGELGVIAIKAGHPAMFKGYWRDQAATDAKYAHGYLLTGDVGFRDAQGYFHYVSRNDDIINHAGRRVGPAEIEAAFEQSAAVALCAVVGMPNALVGQEIVAWLKLRPGFTASRECEREIAMQVRPLLPMGLFPKRVRCVEEMPLTATGKVDRRRIRAMEQDLLAQPVVSLEALVR